MSTTHTLALFADCPVRSKAISKGVAWLRKHRPMVESWARDLKLELTAVQAAIDADLAAAGAARSETGRNEADDGRNISAEITIVITCHNYACYLQDCLDSIAESTLQPTHVIVIDDSSDTPLQPSAFEISNVKSQIDWQRVEYQSQHLSCKHGFDMCVTKYVLWLDADDKLHPDYLSTAVAMLESDREAAFVFPLLQAFGDREGMIFDIDRAPDVVRWADLESRNWCGVSTMFRADVVRQSLAVRTDRVPGCGCNDWITARTVLRSGPWHGLKCPVPLLYRQHAAGAHLQADFPKYELQANIAKERVTIVVAFSGRWPQWTQLREWITSQDWPREQTRIMILNSTHAPLTADMLGLAEWDGLGLQIERIDAGFPRLANQERRGRLDIQRQVDSAVAGLYNRAIQMASDEWILFCEDDVIPDRSDTIAKLFASIGPQVAAVSGVYKHRYDAEAVAFGAPNGKLPMRAMEGDEIEHVTGTGFGCLLARRSVFCRIGLSGDDVRCWFFDVNAGVRVARMGYRWILDRSVYCEHLV
jgi:GT2 family glycosyltransferase